ncbi:hypothetical protein JW949_00465 [Candidatus Woesearchaeota archaeon]|nr:hypothetical protein [Candidatus Woesearchaeota archaeon]
MEKEKLTDEILEELEGDTLNEKLETAVFYNYNVICFLEKYLKENKENLSKDVNIEFENGFIKYKLKNKVLCFKEIPEEGIIYWHNE